MDWNTDELPFRLIDHLSTLSHNIHTESNYIHWKLNVEQEPKRGNSGNIGYTVKHNNTIQKQRK